VFVRGDFYHASLYFILLFFFYVSLALFHSTFLGLFSIFVFVLFAD
jgi:hypothetical protein